MHEGLYEQILTVGLERALRDHPELQAELEELKGRSETQRHLAQFLIHEVVRILKDAGDAKRQTEIINALLQYARQFVHLPEDPTLQVADSYQFLLSVFRSAKPVRPESSLAMSTLLAKPGKPDLGHELGTEMQSADRTDALVSFVTLSGFRRLQDAMERSTRDGKQLRLLTTSYIGATEVDAVVGIAKLPNAQVKISYDTRRTRLHAKAWLFHRKTGFSTGYIGSANVSVSALSTGLEWMMKVTEPDLPQVIGIFRGAFETLWNDLEFEPFDPDHDREKLEEALSIARNPNAKTSFSMPSFFTLRPYPFQEEILDDLTEQREVMGKSRNLIVAATGTGKTMIAAFDYARQSQRPRLLFLAHRRELLEQALQTFRHVLKDGSFGELLAGDEKPERLDYLFATIPSFLNARLLDRLGVDYWPYAVFDECHHIPAPSYRTIIEKLRPRILLGLTATPERTDGQPLEPDFDHCIATEIRLWHALEKQLVVPFEYYGLHDQTDLSAVTWSRGSYSVQELESVYTTQDRRAELIAHQFVRLRGNPQEARALAFCVSIGHAEFMAKKFNECGIKSLAVHGQISQSERESAPRRLRNREANVLFTCDLYNEGVDMPWLDTLLFLRPTSSPMIYLQQLGRGLRLDEGKHSCLVLDFIGQHRREFRFDRILTAVTGIPRGELKSAVEADFPMLPAGCHMHLDKVSRDLILDNLKQTIGGGQKRLSQALRELGDVSLTEFVQKSGYDISQIYSAGGWTHLRRLAGFLKDAAPEGEERLNKKFDSLLHLDEADRLKLYIDLLKSGKPVADQIQEKRMLMLGYQIFHDSKDAFGAFEWPLRLDAFSELKHELIELLELQYSGSSHAQSQFVVPDIPIALHRTYSRREVQTAIGHWNSVGKPQSREGVLRLKEQKLEIFFVTLDKSEKHFSSSTSYEDYAISSTRFHWQSQSQTSADSEAGSRYIQQASNGWTFLLFVRPTTQDEFVALGPVRYESHEGNRPISIVWRLDHHIPAKLFQIYATLLVA